MNADQSKSNKIPLCVDLDGTLIRSDSLIETTALMIKQHFFMILLFPIWLIRGRAQFKEEIATRTEIDAGYLPYEENVLDAIKTARADGRKIILCTGANYRYAQAVADHLKLFDDVIASSASENLTGSKKQQALTQRFGRSGYDYIGNDSKDIPAFLHARKSFLVSPTLPLRKKLASLQDAQVLVSSKMPSPGVYISQLRLHQWMKNILIFVALLTSQNFSNIEAVVAATIAFIAFGFCASSVYVLNDLMDLRADRRHPRKKKRPFASGAIPSHQGLLLVPLLAGIGFSLAIFLPVEFLMMLILYYFVSLNYNLWAKNLAVLDTLFLAGLYTLRVITGAAAISVIPSFWLLAFSMFFFLSVAMAKRYAELINLKLDSEENIPGRQYSKIDLYTIMSQGAASGYASVLVLALYINSSEVMKNYSHPEVFWLTCPLLLYWINKLWLNSQRGEMHDDPLVWALENRVSRSIAVIFILLILMAI